VAPRAPAGTVEELLACLNVPGLQVSNVHTPSPALLRFGLSPLRVDERNQICNLCFGHIESGHAFAGSPIPNNGADVVSIDVFGDEF
jgi:hypothetical protein